MKISELLKGENRESQKQLDKLFCSIGDNPRILCLLSSELLRKSKTPRYRPLKLLSSISGSMFQTLWSKKTVELSCVARSLNTILSPSSSIIVHLNIWFRAGVCDSPGYNITMSPARKLASLFVSSDL